ncbi:MAG: hypothetical protein R6V50_00090 [Thermoplasmatota archaeon]
MQEKSTDTKTTNKEKKIMNDDLYQWISQEDQAKFQKKISIHLKEKKPHGTCQVCGTKMAKNVCIKCENFVCNTCYFHIVGLCKKCLSQQTAQQWKHSKPDWKNVLGVDWVD